MNVLQPWQLLLVRLAGWIKRQQNDVIAYIQEENRILRNKLKGKRLIDPREEIGNFDGPVACRARLGGLLRYDHRRAA